MTNLKLGKMLSILDKYEIILNLDRNELIILADKVADKMQFYHSKTDIVITLLEELKLLKKDYNEIFLNQNDKEMCSYINDNFIKKKEK